MTHARGFIHGRFQIVHNDHLKYLLAGKALCTHMTVGVTNPTPEQTTEEKTDPSRSNAANNPLTYEEREIMLHAVLTEAGVQPETFSIIPFPICKPNELQVVAPKDAVYYLTIYDDWGREKKLRLDSLGLTTHVMWEQPLDKKGITGTHVRQAIMAGRPMEHLVPPATAQLIRKWELQGRFERLSVTSSGS